jgi:hypothetical protein
VYRLLTMSTATGSLITVSFSCPQNSVRPFHTPDTIPVPLRSPQVLTRLSRRLAAGDAQAVAKLSVEYYGTVPTVDQPEIATADGVAEAQDTLLLMLDVMNVTEVLIYNYIVG